MNDHDPKGPLFFFLGVPGGYPRVFERPEQFVYWMLKYRPEIGAPAEAVNFIQPKPPLKKAVVNGVLDPARIEGVVAVVVDITNLDPSGNRVADPVLPDWLAIDLPFLSVAWSKFESSPGLEQFTMVFPLAEPITLAEHATLATRFQAQLPAGATVLPATTPVPFPTAIGKHPDYDFYVARFLGPPVDGKAAVLQGRPSPPLQNWTSDLSRRVVACLMRSEAFRWVRNNQSKASDDLVVALMTSVAEIINAYDASLPSHATPPTRDEVVRACQEAAESLIVNRAGDATANLTKLYWNPCLRLRRRPVPFKELVALGLPEDLAPAAIVHREASGDPDAPLVSLDVTDRSPYAYAYQVATLFDGHDPADWIFYAPHGKYRQLNPKGGVHEEGYQLTHFDKLFPDLAQIKHFRSQIIPVARREPIFDSKDVVVRSGKLWLWNTYVASTIHPKADPTKLEHVLQLVDALAGGDVAGREFILDWLAMPIQALRLSGTFKKLRTALVLHGAQGAGKGTLVSLLEVIYGESNVVQLDQDRLEGKFTEFLEHKLLVVANEVMSATKEERKLANKIKSYVTDPKVVLEGKGEKAYSDINRFNMIFSSNDDRPVRLERGDRRFSVFYSPSAAAPELAGAIYEDLEGHAAAFLEHLLARKVKIKEGTLYQNEARDDVARASMSLPERFADQLATEGYVEVRKLVDTYQEPAMDPAKVGGIPFLHWGALAKLFQRWCDHRGLPTPKDDEALSSALRRRFNLKDKRKDTPRRDADDGKKVTVWPKIPMEIDGDGKVIQESGKERA